MTETKQAGRAVRETEDLTRWVWLAAGAVLTAGAALDKFTEIRKAPDLFESLFFSGFSYLLLISGLVVLIVAVGYPLVFGPESAEDGEGESGSK
jgi:hypothetical protein